MAASSPPDLDTYYGGMFTNRNALGTRWGYGDGGVARDTPPPYYGGIFGGDAPKSALWSFASGARAREAAAKAVKKRLGSTDPKNRLPIHRRTPLTSYEQALEDMWTKGQTTPGDASGGIGQGLGIPLTHTPIDITRYQKMFGQNKQLAADSISQWTGLRDDKRSYQTRLPVEQLMEMGPQDWANPMKTADERARLQYAPQIKASEFARANMAKQGLQNRSDISGWYDLVNSAMADAQTKNTADTRGFSDFATDSSKSLMESLGGASNNANAAVASTVQSNNNMINTLGQVQGNYLTNAKLNAQLEGTQQQTNQMRLNDNADRLAAQQILDLQGKQGASASDYRFTMEGQNKDLQSSRLATRAGLLGQNSEINARNDSTKLTLEQLIGQARKDELIGQRSLANDITGIQKWNAEGALGVQKSNIERENALQTRAQTDATNSLTAATTLLNQVMDVNSQGLRGFKTVDEAWKYISDDVEMLDKIFPGTKNAVLNKLSSFKAGK